MTRTRWFGRVFLMQCILEIYSRLVAMHLHSTKSISPFNPVYFFKVLTTFPRISNPDWGSQHVEQDSVNRRPVFTPHKLTQTNQRRENVGKFYPCRVAWCQDNTLMTLIAWRTPHKLSDQFSEGSGFKYFLYVRPKRIVRLEVSDRLREIMKPDFISKIS